MHGWGGTALSWKVVDAEKETLNLETRVVKSVSVTLLSASWSVTNAGQIFHQYL